MKDYLQELSRQIEARATELPLPQSPQGLYEPIAYILEDGGKRMRPMLTLLGCGMFAPDPSRAMHAAMAIEVFHNFTLLHDDIMDRAAVRRGRPTVHTKWGDNTAILSGDAMMIFAYTLLEKSAYFTQIFPVFSRSAVEVCEGQQLDMEFESRNSVSLDEYIEMIRLKTSALMASAAAMGAIEGGASADEQQALYAFGERLGLAFQIQDDLLDTYGDPQTFGKAIGGDIAEGKQTFLKIAAMQVALPSDKEVLCTSRDFRTVKSLYDAYQTAAAARSAIEGYYHEALACLDRFSAEQSAPLRAYAETILNRNK